MGSPAELLSTTVSSALKSISCSDDQLERLRRLEEYTKGLEEERRKIEAFKRELPFCMQLLHHAIEASKQQLAQCRPFFQTQVSCDADKDSNVQSSSDRTVPEEFIPSKRSTINASSKENSDEEQADKSFCRQAYEDKPSWMTATQLWTPQAEAYGNGQEMCSSGKPLMEKRPLQEQAFSSSSKPFLHSKQRSGGAFLPFSRDRQIVQPAARRGSVNPPDLALSCQDPRVVSPTPVCENFQDTGRKSREDLSQQAKEPVVTQAHGVPADVSNTSQPSRKARRCWSPELHRRFVNALQQLGGSQAATPKQIRELMKVEGLTNDEVKSHLQKYRLHTRRPSPSPQTAAPQTPQLVVLGGIWVPPEYAAHAAVAAARQAPALYDAADQPHLSLTHQEYYSQVDSSGQLHLRSSPYCVGHPNPAQSQSSPQGTVQITGQSSAGLRVSGDACREESVGEDGKSENSSWKGQEPRTSSHEVDETEDQRSLDGSADGSQSKYTGENYTELEDSGGSETRLKI